MFPFLVNIKIGFLANEKMRLICEVSVPDSLPFRSYEDMKVRNYVFTVCSTSA
jgi:hypothetical protein